METDGNFLMSKPSFDLLDTKDKKKAPSYWSLKRFLFDR